MGTLPCDADDKLGGESRCSMRRITVLRTTASWPACPYSLLIPPPITSKHFLSAIKEWGYVRQPNARVISPHTELRLSRELFYWCEGAPIIRWMLDCCQNNSSANWIMSLYASFIFLFCLQCLLLEVVMSKTSRWHEVCCQVQPLHIYQLVLDQPVRSNWCIRSLHDWHSVRKV